MTQPEVVVETKVSNEAVDRKELMVNSAVEDESKGQIIGDKTAMNKDSHSVLTPKLVDSEEWWMMAGLWFSMTTFFVGFLFIMYLFLPSFTQIRNAAFPNANIANVKYILINDQGYDGLNLMSKIKNELLAQRKTHKYKREEVEDFDKAIARYR